jgi:carboxylate-amine ligase
MGMCAPTVGVEEEFLLVDPVTRRPVPAAPLIVDAVAGEQVDVHRELTPAQIETVTRVCGDLAELYDQLVSGRRRLVSAARRAGCRVIGSGTPPIGDPGPPPLTRDPRYGRMAIAHGALMAGQGVCGCHVHIGVDGQDRAIQVCNQLRPWLPVLLALGANSPFADGRDTGYASWRSIVWSRWPSCGMPPYFRSVREYDAVVGALIDSGTIIDRRMIYWHARPSAHLPTVEVRVADAAPTAERAVLLAGLVRALTATAESNFDAARLAPTFSEPVGRASCWRAARDGLDGWGVDLRTGAPARAWDLVDGLVDYVRDALVRNGDLSTVVGLIRELRVRGSSAARQRAVYGSRGDPGDVVDFLATEVTAGAHAGVHSGSSGVPISKPT